MGEYDGMRPGELLAEAKVAEFISELGLGIAKAQRALDTNSIEQLDFFLDPIDGLGGRRLFEMGFTPAFYHYQHADLSVTMNLRLRVEKDSGVDLGIDASFDQGGSTGTGAIRLAEVQVPLKSKGELSMGNDKFQLEGNDYRERIDGLADALRESRHIEWVGVRYDCSPVNPSSSETLDPSLIVLSPNAVAFIGSTHQWGLIRISKNPNDPMQIQLNEAVEIEVTKGSSRANFAEKVATAIDGQDGFEARVLGGEEPWATVHFETGSAQVSDVDDDRKAEVEALEQLAHALRETGIRLRIEGHADTQSFAGRESAVSERLNQELSHNRAKAVEAFLVDRGLDAEQFDENSVVGKGKDEARQDGDAGQANDQFRRADVLRHQDDDNHYVLVRASGSHRLEDVEPELDAEKQDDNRWLRVGGGNDMAELNDVTLSIRGRNFDLSGTREGHDDDAATAFAANLAAAINAEHDQVVAAARGSVTRLCMADDKAELTLLSTSARALPLDGTDGIEIGKQFEATDSEREKKERSGNRAVAVGVSLDARYARQFELDMTGNSSISARLVAVPAPPEFLDTIREFLEE